MKAVPTPRLDVGENTFAAQLLRGLVSLRLAYREKTHDSHNQGKQAIKTSYGQEDREVRSAYTLLRCGGEDNVSNQRHTSRGDDVPSSVMSAIAVPGL